MQEGDHANRTPWGNLGLRLPHPEDPGWAADRETILVALGVLDGSGGYGPRYNAMYETGMIQLDREAYQQQRYKLVQACKSCHAMPFIREQLDRRDRMMRQSDALTAAALRQVVALYTDGVLKREGPGPFPDLVRAPLGPPIEQRLAAMFFDHRARLMATAFHMSQEWPTWVSTMEGDFVAIDQMADDLRARPPGAKPGKKHDKKPPKR